jgi:hypothetical protein
MSINGEEIQANDRSYQIIDLGIDKKSDSTGQSNAHNFVGNPIVFSIKHSADRVENEIEQKQHRLTEYHRDVLQWSDEYVWLPLSFFQQ